MSKKIAVGFVSIVLLIGLFGFGAVNYASAQNISLSQLIEILISIGVIPPDKAVAARAILGGGQGANTAITNIQTKIDLKSVPNNSYNPNSYDYIVSSNKIFDKVVFRADCLDSQIEINAKGGMFCGEETNINFGISTQYSYPVTWKSKDGISRTVGMTVSVYYNGVLIGTDRDAITVQSNQVSTPSIIVLSPNGQSWQSGTTQTIRWTDSAYTNGVNYTVFATQSNGNGYGVIADNVYGTSVNWNVGTILGGKLAELAQGQSYYYIQIVRQTQPSVSSANYPFTIISPQTTNTTVPSITYTSVSSVTQGGSVTVYGMNFGSNPFVMIDGQSGTVVPPSSVSNNAVTFAVPTNISAGPHSIQVRRGNNMSPSNIIYLTVTSAQSLTTVVQPSITVLSPNGGEALRVGQTYTISWKGASNSGYSIYLSGNESQKLIGSANVTGSADTVTSIKYSPTSADISPTGSGLFILVCPTGEAASITFGKCGNSALFTITAPQTVLVSPLSVTCVGIPSSSNITWSSSIYGGSGIAKSYSWTFYNDGISSGGNSALAAATLTYGSTGTKQATVLVTDSVGNSASTYCSATITTPITTQTNLVPIRQTCGGTEPVANGYVQKGYNYYTTGYSPSSWTYITYGTPSACQYTCVSGGTNNGSGCSAPVVTLTNGIGYDYVPASVVAGQIINVRVTNRGTKTWGSSHDLALSNSNLTSNLQMVNLGSTPPNTPVNVSFTAPTTPGTYVIRAVEQNVEWFGSNQTITVTAPQVIAQPISAYLNISSSCLVPGTNVTATAVVSGDGITSKVLEKDTNGDGVYGQVANWGGGPGTHSFTTTESSTYSGRIDLKLSVNGVLKDAKSVMVSSQCAVSAPAAVEEPASEEPAAEQSNNTNNSNFANVLIGYDSVMKLLQILR